jgi:ankyrin repeat protein
MIHRFRWVACQIEALGYCLDYRRLRAVLEGLPEGLDETYAQILGSISEDHRQIANTILGLLIWSLRPLRLKEMVDAIAVDLEASPTFDPRNRMSDPRDVLRSCQGLVILSPDVETTVGEAQEQDQQFELAHFSVRDYLLSGRVHASIGHCMNRPFANAQIAKICLAYLSSIAHSSSSEDMRLQYPFVRYSASYWADHVRLAEDTDHVLSDIVVALQAACSKGPDGVVKILLDGGADVNAQGGEYGNALQAASANGHVNILKILLGKGADINARSGRHGTALHAALLSGSYEMVQTLLGMGADVNAQDEDSRTVLHQASQKGLDQIVQILLEYGAEIDVRGGCEYDTALQLAALEGHREIVQILVNHGADINAQSNTHGTALQIASEGGHESIVRILLDSGAHVTVADQPTRANEHHEGHSNVAYSAFHDSGYSSHQTQPMVDDRKGENLQPMDDDNASVGTVDVDIQSSAESLPLSNVREAAAREVARAFIEDDEISNLYDEGLERMDNAGFIENHRRLLKLFYLEATKDAKAAAHHVVLRFLRSRIARIRVSARIIEAKEIPDEEIELAMNRGQSLQLINGILTQADKKRDTSHWTEELQSGLYEQTDMFPGYGESTWTSLAYESSTSELPADELDDDEDFDASKEEEADPRENYLPALVNTRAFLMGSRAFRIYRSNLQRFAHGKHIAPTAFRIALLADDLALAIELLENESEAITQFRLGFEWIKEPLAMGFTPSEVVRLIIQRQEDPSYKDDGDQAIGAGRWNQARGLLRGEEPRASHKRLINEHLIATDRPAVDSSEQLHDPVPRLEHVSGRGAYDLSENIFWKYLQSYLMTQYAHSLISSGPHVLLERRLSKDKSYLAVILAIPKRMMSRAREFMIYSGLILGPLEPGHTRITWKSVSSAP